MVSASQLQVPITLVVRSGSSHSMLHEAGCARSLPRLGKKTRKKTTVNDQLLPEEIAATLFRGQRLCAVTRRVNVNSFDLSASAASDSVTSGTWQGRK